MYATIHICHLKYKQERNSEITFQFQLDRNENATKLHLHNCLFILARSCFMVSQAAENVRGFSRS